MQINLNPTYISDSSSARRQPIPVDINLDPTANSITAPFKQSRWNGYISPIGLNKNISAMLVGIQTAAFGSPDTNATTGNGGTNPEPLPGTPPLQVANLAASYVGSNIVLTFDFDMSDPQNQFFFNFNVGVSLDNGTTFTVISPSYNASLLSFGSTSQTVTIKSTDSGFANSVSFNSVEVATYDGAGQTAGYVKAAISNTYHSLLPAPVITEADTTSAYSITTTNLDTAKATPHGNFLSEIIQEFVYPTTGLTSTQVDAAVATATTGWVQVGEPKTVSPTSVFAADGAHRYVRAFFLETTGAKSDYSNYVEATPGALLPANNLPPANATNVSAVFSNSGAGDDVVVTYTLPTIVDSDVNKPVIVKVKLVPTDAAGLSGFFYHTIASKTETSFTIPKNLIFTQFGQYYKSYSGSLVLQSQYGTESSTVQNINTFTRTSSIVSVIPTATITNVIDGYNVQFALGSSGAAHGEVYQFFIDPTGSFDTVDMPDYMDAAFVSGGASGQKTFVVNSISMENGGFTLPTGKTVNAYVGYPITGKGIPANTWVTSITGSGPYTITVNNNLSEQAVGNYHMQALVYSGMGPASVFDNLYTTGYLILRYYDIYETSSQNSIVYHVTPESPSVSVIQNAVQVGSGGAIYVGNSATTGSRIVLGPSGNKGPDGTSAYSGIFAFDYGSTSGSAASTAIITNPSSSSYTFETTNAKIADWIINSTQIQNTLDSGASNYVGLSATGTYSFWAGSATSGGDSSAKFSVTPAGKVSARDITIIGSGNNSDTLLSAGTGFYVYGDGSITATKATITGSINVSQASTFGSSVTIGPAGYLIVGANNTANVKIGSAGITASPDGSTITTQISSSPIGADGVTLATNSAYLGSLYGSSGAWIVKSGKIYSGQLELSSANGTITAYPTDYNSTQNNYGVRIYGGSSTSNGYAISVGALSGTPKFFVDHLGNMTASSATITGNITATTGTLGDSAGKHWTINSNYVRSSGSDAYITLDAVGDQVQAYASSSTALGSLVTYTASNAGGSIGSVTSTAAGLATTASFGAGQISSTAYTVISTTKPLQVFGSAQSRGALPLFSLDPDGSSTTWNHTNDGGLTYTQQHVGASFAAINTGVIYLNSDDIIMGTSPSSYGYLNGNYTLRNDTDVVGTHQYLRNIYINSGAGPTVGSTGTGFVGDLYITY